jgi:uncharacterized protein (TIGR02246 family)
LGSEAVVASGTCLYLTGNFTWKHFDTTSNNHFMKHFSASFIVMACVYMLACSPASDNNNTAGTTSTDSISRQGAALDTTVLRREIEAQNKLYSQAYRDGDARGVASLYTEDAQLMAQGMETLTGREKIQAFTQGAIQMGVKDLQLITLQVNGSGNFAYETGRSVVGIQTPKGTIADTGRYVVVWKKVAGQDWKMHIDMINSARPQ